MKEQQSNPEIINKESIANLKILRKRSWIPIIIFIALTIASLGYLLFGKIPITGEGNAIFLVPESVIPFQSTASGQVKRWNVQIGDDVTKGQILADLEQPVITKELELAKEKLAGIIIRNKSIETLIADYANKQKMLLQSKAQDFDRRIQDITEEISTDQIALKQMMREKTIYLTEHSNKLQEMLKENRARYKNLQENLSDTMKLYQSKDRTEDQLIAAKQQCVNQREQIGNIQLQIAQQRITEILDVEYKWNKRNDIATKLFSLQQFKMQRQEIAIQQVQLNITSQQSLSDLKMEEQTLRHTIQRYKKQLEENSKIVCKHNGRILELNVSQGKIINEGLTLGSIKTFQSNKELQAVVYFKMADGKKIKIRKDNPMKLRLTPATVERRRFGSLIARIIKVSSFPVSIDRVAKVVGNSDIADALTKDGHQIEVIAELEKTDSGYKWDTEAGSSVELTPGTMASALINFEEKPPLAFVIPLLKDWAGFDMGEDKNE